MAKVGTCSTYEALTFDKVLSKDVNYKSDMLKIINYLSYIGDKVMTTHDVDFKNELLFEKAINNCYENVPPLLEAQCRKNLLWRFHITCWAASKCLHVDGDFVELGVWYGLLSRAMCEYVDFSNVKNKKFILVDSWGRMEGSHPNYDDDIYSVVQNRFQKFKNVQLIRGLVPPVLNEIKSAKIAYLGIDMNGSKPERAALEILYNRVSPGGIIYFDDYGWGYPELRKEIKDFLKDKPEKLLHFPSGNSIIVKI